jgi:DNA-binding NtrC family response regulator
MQTPLTGRGNKLKPSRQERIIMATILLNESDPVRRELLRLRLQREGYKIWPAQNLNDIIATLHDVAVDVMILDLDHQNLDELAEFANRWKGIRIIFQASSTALLQDFRCWMADQFVFKFQNGENVSRAVTQLLQAKSAHRRNNYRPQRSDNYVYGQVAVA